MKPVKLFRQWTVLKRWEAAKNKTLVAFSIRDRLWEMAISSRRSGWFVSFTVFVDVALRVLCCLLLLRCMLLNQRIYL